MVVARQGEGKSCHELLVEAFCTINHCTDIILLPVRSPAIGLPADLAESTRLSMENTELDSPFIPPLLYCVTVMRFGD